MKCLLCSDWFDRVLFLKISITNCDAVPTFTSPRSDFILSWVYNNSMIELFVKREKLHENTRMIPSYIHIMLYYYSAT